MTEHELVAAIIRQLDQTRIDNAGGYPSDWFIENRTVYIASLDAGKDYNAPKLTVMPINDFLREHEWLIAYIEEENEDV